MAAGTQDAERLRLGDQDFPTEGPADDLDRFGGEAGDVGEGAVLALSPITVGLADQVGLILPP